MNIYITGSMRGERVLSAATALRTAGHRIFVDWFMPGPRADEWWRLRAMELGHTYSTALRSAHAKHVFEFDMHWLGWCDAAVMVMPCGKSAWAEMGWLRGQGKPVWVWLETPDPERWDIMLQLASGWTQDLPQLLRWLAPVPALPSPDRLRFDEIA